MFILHFCVISNTTPRGNIYTQQTKTDAVINYYQMEINQLQVAVTSQQPPLAATSKWQYHPNSRQMTSSRQYSVKLLIQRKKTKWQVL